MTKLAVTTANTCVGVYADSEADTVDGTAESGARGAEALDADWDDPAQAAAFRPLHTNRPPPSRVHKSAPAQPKPTPSIPRAPALPRELRPPIAASRRDLTTARPSSAKRSETRKRRLSPPKKPSKPEPTVAEVTRPTKPSPAAAPAKPTKTTTVSRSSGSIPPRPVSIVPRPASKSVPPPAPSASAQEKQTALPKKSLRPLPPRQRSKPPATEQSSEPVSATDNDPIPLAKRRPAKPRQPFTDKPSLAASYVASLGSSIPPTMPSPGTEGSSVEAAAADQSGPKPPSASAAAMAFEEPQDNDEPTRLAVPRPAAESSPDAALLDADADGEDTEVVDRETIRASRWQAREEREVEPEHTPSETLLPPSTPTAASGQAMESIHQEASAAEPPPAAEEHPPPATETDAPVAMDVTPTSIPAPADASADLLLARLGKARGVIWGSPRARWAAGAGALAIGVAALFMLTSEQSESGDAELAATIPAPAEQGAVPQVKLPEARPEAAKTPEPAPVAVKTVAVQTYPADAVIYSGGERLGTGTAEVRLPAGEEKTLEVKRKGYVSRQVVLDGSASEVSIALVKRDAVTSANEKPVEEAEPEAVPQAEPEAAPEAEPVAPDPLAGSVRDRDDPYSSVPDPDPSEAKPATPSRDDPYAAVPSGKGISERWEENPGF
jgi:hypothetical protein